MPLSLKAQFTYMIAFGFAKTVGILPKAMFYAFSSVLEKLVVLLARKDRKIIQCNIELVYGLPKHSSFSLSFVRQSIQSSVRCSLETLRILSREQKFEILDLEPAARRLAELSSDTPAVIITSHLGSWELAGACLTKISAKSFYGLAKPSKNLGFSKFLDTLRTKAGINVIWTGRKSLVKDMMAVLKQGALLGFVMDQKPIGNQGPKVNFLGQQTTFVSGPASMALHFNCPVFSFHLVRLNHMKYRLVFSELFYPQDISIENLTAIMAQNLEQVIRQYPEQWCWNYRRWKFKN